MNSEPSLPATQQQTQKAEQNEQRIAAEGGGRRLTRSRGGISLRAKRVGGSFCGDLDLRSWCWRLILLGLPFFAVYSEERRGCTCVYGLLDLSGSRLHWSVGHMGLAREVGWTPFAETTSSYAEITLLFFFEQ